MDRNRDQEELSSHQNKGSQMEAKSLLETLERHTFYTDDRRVEIGSQYDVQAKDVHTKASVIHAMVKDTNKLPLVNGGKASTLWYLSLFLGVLIVIVVSLHTTVTKGSMQDIINRHETDFGLAIDPLRVEERHLKSELQRVHYEYENKIGPLKSELDETKALLVLERQKRANLSTTIDALSADAESYHRELVHCQALLTSKEESIGRLESELSDLKSDLRAERENFAYLGKAMDTLQNQFKTINTKSDDVISMMKTQLDKVEKINKRKGFKVLAGLEELQKAVDAYLLDGAPTSCIAEKYGYPIGKWDVSRVTSFRELFHRERNGKAAEFNEDLSGWDVSGGRDFSMMFRRAYTFKGKVSSWDMSSAETTRQMFDEAYAFDGDLSEWDVSNVADMGGMFYYATKFNCDIGNWNVSKVTSVTTMFGPGLEEKFRGRVSSWDLRQVQDKDTMFEGAWENHRGAA